MSSWANLIPRVLRHLAAAALPFSLGSFCPTLAAAAPCSVFDTTIAYGNGVDATWDSANDARLQIQRSLPEIFSTSEINKINPVVVLSYNTTLGKPLDLLETFLLLVNSGSNNSRYIPIFWKAISGTTQMPPQLRTAIGIVAVTLDAVQLMAAQNIDEHSSTYREKITRDGEKVVLVAHSEGTLFANEAFRRLTITERRSFGIVGVAALDTIVLDAAVARGDWVTLTTDIWVNRLRAAFGSLPGNVTNFLTSLDTSGHTFLGSYLALGTNSRSAIWNSVVSTRGRLVRPAFCDQQPIFEGIGFFPGGAYSDPFSVSANGTVVVGQATTADGQIRAFRWTPAAAMVELGGPPGVLNSVARGVNSDGSVVVGYYNNPEGISEAFRWTEATGMKGLGFLWGENGSIAHAVNADGSIVVGQAIDSTGSWQAFRWTASTGMVGLGQLQGSTSSAATAVNSDGTIVVGSANFANRAFRWTAGSGITAVASSGGTSVESALGVSADGAIIVGIGIDANGRDVPVQWTEGGLTTLGLPDGAASGGAFGVSADGSVVVGGGFAGPFSAPISGAFRWTAESGTQGIEDLLATVGADIDWRRLGHAAAVSADGSAIVGAGVDADGKSQGWIVRPSALLRP